MYCFRLNDWSLRICYQYLYLKLCRSEKNYNRLHVWSENEETFLFDEKRFSIILSPMCKLNPFLQYRTGIGLQGLLWTAVMLALPPGNQPTSQTVWGDGPHDTGDRMWVSCGRRLVQATWDEVTAPNYFVLGGSGRVKSDWPELAPIDGNSHRASESSMCCVCFTLDSDKWSTRRVTSIIVLIDIRDCVVVLTQKVLEYYVFASCNDWFCIIKTGMFTMVVKI